MLGLKFLNSLDFCLAILARLGASRELISSTIDMDIPEIEQRVRSNNELMEHNRSVLSQGSVITQMVSWQKQIDSYMSEGGLTYKEAQFLKGLIDQPNLTTVSSMWGFSLDEADRATASYIESSFSDENSREYFNFIREVGNTPPKDKLSYHLLEPLFNEFLDNF